MKVGTIKKAVAALVVATAATAGISGAAFATKNDGRYQRSAEAHRQQFVDPCDGIWNQFETDVNQAHKSDQHGYKNARDGFLLLADAALEAGQKAGCDWAAPQ